MFVLCPKCKTKYRVDETKIGPEGAKIKCAKCTTIFKVLKPVRAASPAQAPAKPAPGPAPAAQPARPAPAPTPAPAAPPAPPVPPTTAEISGPYLPKTAPKATLLLADADEVFLNKIGGELLNAGYAVWYARGGEAALNFIREKKPPVAIIEVMLPGLFGFEVCEKVKSDPAIAQATKLILIGSVYEKNRFRRAPISLYGADEYVDKYHDGVAVLAKVEKVLGFAPAEAAAEETIPEQAGPEVAPPPPPQPVPATPPQMKPAPQPAAPAPRPTPAAPGVKPPGPTPAPRPAAPPPRPAVPSPVRPAPQAPAPGPKPGPVPPVAAKPMAGPTTAPTPPTPKPAPVVPPPAAVPPTPPKPASQAPASADWTKSVPDDPAHQKAARLARTIAADIALYNPDLVERGVRDGNFWELLAKDIDDGQKHYQSKVGPEIQAAADYFKLALEDLIAKKKKKLGLS